MLGPRDWLQNNGLVNIYVGYIDPGLAMKSRIMYIEHKGIDGISGPARIGRVTFSKSGRTIYYRGKQFQNLGGRGFKANYFDIEAGEEYWISGPKKNGCDRLYAGTVEIDEDVRDEYWRQIRGQAVPQTRHTPRFPAKYRR